MTGTTRNYENEKEKKIKIAENIAEKFFFINGKDEFQYVGSLNKDNIRQFVEELEDFVNKWDFRIFQCTNRIEENRSR